MARPVRLQPRPAPYGQQVRRPKTGMVGPIPMTGAEGDGGAMQWLKDNKWYALGGGLILAAGVTYFATRDRY